jgi:F-type H+-transporting ATPase subunit alpha
MLKQKERQPLSVPDQVASIYSGTGGYLDRIKVDRVPDFLSSLLERLHADEGELLKGIEESGELSDEDEEKLGKAIAVAVDDFGPDFDEDGQPLEEGESDRIKDEEERQRGRHTEDEGDSEDEDEGDEKEKDEGETAEQTEEKETAAA